jgi:phosphomannomutase
MVMNYLKKRIHEAENEKKKEHPDWVSSKNATLRAWEYVEQLKKEKMLYIKRHHKITDFITQKTYQIKGAEVALALNINRASLMNTSNFSPKFRVYLESVNSELEASKEAKLKKHKSSSRGPIKSSKDDLVAINKKLKKRVAELEKLKTEKLVRYAFDQLPLPVKQKLGID